jgi:hypothetical protein
LKNTLVTEELMDVPLDVMPPLSVNQTMVTKPESDSHPEPERHFPPPAEPPSVSSPQEDVLKNPSSRQETNSIFTEERELTSPRFRVLTWIPSTILTVVVTTNIWVNPVPSLSTHPPVKKSVLSVPEELVEFVVVLRISN